MAYNPSVPPQLDDDLLPFLQDELLRIAQAFNDITDGQLGVRHTMPLRYKPGTLLYLSGGPSANPLGTGQEGLYYYTTSNQWIFVGGGGGPSPGGAVDSVNGKTGVVTLTASDVSAEPLGTVDTAMSTHTGAADPHVQYALKNSLKPVATSGAYADLTGKPALFSGNYNDLVGKPALFSGAYNDLTGKPVLFSGSYNDLSNKPVLFSGAYGDLTGVPTSFPSAWNTLSGKPSTFASTWSLVTSKPTTVAGYGITDMIVYTNQQPDNLVIRGNFQDGSVFPWTTSTGATPTEVVSISDPTTAFNKAGAFYANSFCGVTFNILTAPGEVFEVTAEVSGDEMTAGQTGNIQLQFYNSANVNLGYGTAFVFPATTGEGFKKFSGRITAPSTATSARFLTRIMPANPTGRALWCNIHARRLRAADLSLEARVAALEAYVAAHP